VGLQGGQDVGDGERGGVRVLGAQGHCHEEGGKGGPTQPSLLTEHTAALLPSRHQLGQDRKARGHEHVDKTPQ
jgi:hypothetical protein